MVLLLVSNDSKPKSESSYGSIGKNNVLLFKHPFKTTKIGHISSNKTYLPNSRVLLKDM